MHPLKNIATIIFTVFVFSQILHAESIKHMLGMTPLMYAIWQNKIDVVKTLIANGADVNVNIPSRDPDSTPLMLSSRHGHVNIMKILIDNGADVNAKSKTGYTALMRAARNNQFKAVKLLIENNANVNAYNSGGMSALKFASSHNHRYSTHKIIMMKYLLRNGANCSDINYLPMFKRLCSGRTIYR